MGDVNPNTQQARALIAGGFADFLMYLTNLPSPIVVGDGYTRTRLFEAFKNWAKISDFDTTGADTHLWRDACHNGFLREVNDAVL